MRRTLAPVLLAFLVAGCARPPEPPASGAPAPEGASAFTPPALRVGDRLEYAFTFTQGNSRFSGPTVLSVVERIRSPDGYGVLRDALHLRQSNPDGTFAEDYWIDAETYAQFHVSGTLRYTEVSHAPPGPLSPLPFRGTSYANATGLRDGFLDDPAFEDANFFGVFAAGLALPESGSIAVQSNLWQRNGTRLLAPGPFDGLVSTPPPDNAWGPLRRLAATASYNGGDHDRETITWTGDFAATVPLAVAMDRRIIADFFGETFDVRFNATLQAFTPGAGDPVPRLTRTAASAVPAGDRAAWSSAPIEGAARLGFPLGEALAALGRDPTAAVYFQQHTGSYLYYANLYDVDTCGFYGATRPPGCHWTSWEGFYFAPDDFILSFTVEKFANDDGNGVSYTPIVTRGKIVADVFRVAGGSAPPPPTVAVEAAKYNGDLPARDAFPKEGLTISGAIDLWARHADGANQGQTPNRLWFHLGPEGYEFYVAYNQWWFPEKNPQLFFLYDNMPFELERHSSIVHADGRVAESRNYVVTIDDR